MAELIIREYSDLDRHRNRLQPLREKVEQPQEPAETKPEQPTPKRFARRPRPPAQASEEPDMTTEETAAPDADEGSDE